MNILGLDLSLTATGLATVDHGILTAAWTFKGSSSGLNRLRGIVAEVYAQARDTKADLVVLEGPAYGAQAGQQGHHERAGLWWLVYDRLDRNGYPVVVVPPKSLKKYAAGKGNASKEDVLVAAVRRLPEFDGDNNAADAAWLAVMAADHRGEPVIEMPAANREAIKGVAWPELAGRQALDTGGTP